MDKQFENFSYEDYYNHQLNNLPENEKIKTLDDLIDKLISLIEGWLQTKKDEQALRQQEMFIHEALLRLKLDQDFKNKNVDLFVQYLKLGDDEKLINLVKREFDLQQVPSGSMVIAQIENEIDTHNRLSGQENLDSLSDNIVDNKRIKGDISKN
jgi:hypothetical protein